MIRVARDEAARDERRGMSEASLTSATDPRVEIQSRLAVASAYNQWIARQVRTYVGRRVLDAGCGSGNITRLMLDRDLVVAVDAWPDFVEIVRDSFANAQNVQSHQYDLSDPTMVDALRPYDLDSAFCVNVLEHVEDDRGALSNIMALLPPRGRLFLLVPAFPGLYGKMDEVDHHFRRYTKASLHDTVAGLPLAVERLYYMNMPGFFSWFVYGRILRRAFVSEELYARVVRILERLESRRRPPFGQSLVAVLRKRG
jgi:SAM-dependent methyltransferase